MYLNDRLAHFSPALLLFTQNGNRGKGGLVAANRASTGACPVESRIAARCTDWLPWRLIIFGSRNRDDYNQIKAHASDVRQQEKLLSVFMDWLTQRFAERGLQEIEKMLMGDLPHLRETQAGKDLIAIGVAQGIEKGALIGSILTCQGFLRLMPTERPVLEAQSVEELRQMAEQLQAVVTRRLRAE